MDFVKLNRRWVYSLTLEVLARNFLTLVVIAALNAAIGVAQAFLGFFGLLLFPVAIYLVVVTMMICHKTVVTGKGVLLDEAFAFNSKVWVYFWQYFGISLLPILIIFGGAILIYLNYPPRFGLEMSVLLLTGLAFSSYYLVLAFFGTSLTATAVGGDGMMMISRGRITFLYSLSRQLFLPFFIFAVIFGGLWYYFDQLTVEEVEALVFSFATLIISSKAYLVLLLLAAQLCGIFMVLLSGVILTKAFVLAELKMAVRGDVSNWGAKAFNIDTTTQEVQYV